MNPTEQKIDLLSLAPEELEQFLAQLGEPRYRAGQLFSAMHRGVPLEAITNISKATKEKISAAGFYRFPTIKRKLVSAIDGTVKYLFALRDGELIESVVMKYKHGNTICVSSQAGCRMGCRFCASTLRGLTRNLNPSEILGQVMAAQADLG